MPELDLDMWLQGEDIEKCPKGVFINEGKSGEIPGKGEEEGTPTFEIGVQLDDGTKRLWTMNKSSQRVFAKIYGLHTKDWVGKPFECYVSIQNVMGHTRKVIYAKCSV